MTAVDGRKDKKASTRTPREHQMDKRMAKLEESQARSREETADRFNSLNATLKEIMKSMALTLGHYV